MSADFEISSPLPGARFGSTLRLARRLSQGVPDGLPGALADAGGLLLVPGLTEIAQQPELLVELSRAFGPEVEDYRYTLTSSTSVHTTVPEIFMVSNMAPVNRAPPKRPEPPLTADGGLPVQYPHRRGWHTDQSYRRPPPDISLFYAVTPVARERYRIGVPPASAYRETLNSDAAEYAGSDVRNFGDVDVQPVAWHGRDRSIELRIPPLGAVILAPVLATA